MKNRKIGRTSRPLVAFLAAGLLFLFAGAPAHAQSAASATLVTYRPPGPDMLEGRLTFDAAAKSIAWGDASSEATFAAPEAAAEFVSQPLPRDVHVNVSRDLELDLNLGGYTAPNSLDYDVCHGNFPDPRIDVQLLLDGKLFAGVGSTGVVIDYRGPSGQFEKNHRPADPAGFTTCRYRMHSEADLLPKGAKITLVLTPGSHSKPLVYGLMGEQASIVRIPYYNDDDWAFRDPTNPIGEKAQSSFQADPSAIMASGLLVLVSGLGLRGRGGRRNAFLLAAVFGAGTLAGCTSSTGPSPDDLGGPIGGSAQASFIPGDSHLTANGTGSIAGFVHDDLFQPLVGVHVNGKRLANFGETDALGRFLFARVAPGIYPVRFELADYPVFETPVEVRAGYINKLDVTLVPLSNATGDLRSHPHDNWNGATSKEVFNGTFGKDCGPSFFQVTTACYPRYTFYSDPGLFTTILPGTYDIEVRIFADPTHPPPAAFVLSVNANNEGGPNAWQASPGYNWTLLYPRPPGVPFHVRSNWEMTDVGHQPFSTVQFAVNAIAYPPGELQDQAYEFVASDLQQQAYEFATGPFFGYDYPTSASITVHKGLVPLEPRHPDHWGAATAKRVLAGSPWDVGLSSLIVAPFPGASHEWVPTSIVPPGTAWLEVFANQSRPSLTPAPWILEHTLGTTPLSSSYPEGYVSAPPATDTVASHVWRIPIADGQEDFFYSKHSAFRFRLTPGDEASLLLDTGGGSFRPDGDFEMSLDVVAHRGPIAA